VRFNERRTPLPDTGACACAPYRAQTKGKDERGVGYVKPIFNSAFCQVIDGQVESALGPRRGTTFPGI
jgi:transposase